MIYLEYPFAHAGALLATPVGSGNTIAVIVDGAPVRFCWRQLTDPTQLVMCPDGDSGLWYQDPALLATSQIMVTFSHSRLRIVRFLMPDEFGVAMNQTFGPPPVDVP